MKCQRYINKIKGYKGYIARLSKDVEYYKRRYGILKKDYDKIIEKRIAWYKRRIVKLNKEIEYYKGIYKVLIKDYENIRKQNLELIKEVGDLRTELRRKVEVVVSGEKQIDRVIIGVYKIKDKVKIKDILDVDNISDVVYKYLNEPSSINPYVSKFLNFIVAVCDRISIYPLIIRGIDERTHGLNVIDDIRSYIIKLFSIAQKVLFTGIPDELYIYCDLNYYVPYIEVIDEV